MSAIIFINRYFYPDHSATSQLLTDLAFELARQGKDVRVITSRQIYDDAEAGLPETETVDGVKIYRVWTSRFGRHRLWGRALDYASFYLSTAWRLARLARKGDVVVAKTDPPLISVPTMLVARLRGASTLNWLQDLFPEVASSLGITGINAIAPFLRRLRNKSLRAARLNIVLGDGMAERVRAEGVPAECIRVIHNWSDGRVVRPIACEANEFRRLWGISNRFVVGYSGNMGRAHEFETIVGAAERLVSDDRLVFLFIGGGAKRAWLERECFERGIGNVLFRPYQRRDSLAESLSVPDVHLISLYPELEGLIVPSKFYGIAAVGRPVIYIGNPEGEIPRILRAGGCGHTIVPGNSDRLAGLLTNLASDSEMVSRMGSNARRLFEQRFDRPIALQMWQEVLQ